MSTLFLLQFHYQELLKIPQDKFSDQVEQIAKVLSEKAEIMLSPDRGICLEIARKYKELGGKKATGIAPLSDKVFGIAHLKPGMELKVNDKKVFDSIINTNTWYEQHFAFGLFGDVILMLASTLGTFYEFSSAFYVYKIISRNKPEVSVIKKKINKYVIAGDRIPLSIIFYKPFMKEDLPLEIKEHIKRAGGQVYYAKNPDDLRRIISDLNQLTNA